MAAKLVVKRLGFYWLETWIMANIIQLATQDFCNRFLNRTNDPCGRQFDQMTQAARSVQANIAEGSTRHFSSRETEMKLTDVARASLAELMCDYINWLMQMGKTPWSLQSSNYQHILYISLDKPIYTKDVQMQSAAYILAQKGKFDTWLLSEDSEIVVNCIIILCNRLINMLAKHLDSLLSMFKEDGGFTEALTAERLSVRTEQSIQENAPLCPICNAPMIRRTAKRGVNAGKEFWSCSNYPNCTGTRKIGK